MTTEQFVFSFGATLLDLKFNLDNKLASLWLSYAVFPCIIQIDGLLRVSSRTEFKIIPIYSQRQTFTGLRHR